MADHRLSMWDLAANVALVDPKGKTVARLYVEDDGGETYLEVECRKVVELRLTNELLCFRFVSTGEGRKRD